jgi:hypothetical protein
MTVLAPEEQDKPRSKAKGSLHIIGSIRQLRVLPCSFDCADPAKLDKTRPARKAAAGNPYNIGGEYKFISQLATGQGMPLPDPQ